MSGKDRRFGAGRVVTSDDRAGDLPVFRLNTLTFMGASRDMSGPVVGKRRLVQPTDRQGGQLVVCIGNDLLRCLRRNSGRGIIGAFLGMLALSIDRDDLQ